MSTSKLFIIISNSNSWRVKWHQFHLTNTDEYLLIADKNSCSQLMATPSSNFFLEIRECAVGEDTGFVFEDLKKIVSQVVNQYKNRNLHIITVNEDDIIHCVHLRIIFGLQGDKFNEVEKYIDKTIMKECLRTNKKLCQHIPKYLVFLKDLFENEPNQYLDYVISQLNLPIFIKPINAAGSRNVFKAHDSDELYSWMVQHTHSKITFEMDEFIEGDLFQCHSVIQNGKIKIALVSQSLNPYSEVTLKGKWPGSIILREKDEIAKKITKFNQKVINTLQPEGNFVTYHEMFIKKNNEIIFLEIAKRNGGGCLLSEMYEHYNGINLREIDYKLRLGIDIHIQKKSLPQKKYYACIVIPKMEISNLNVKSNLMILAKNINTMQSTKSTEIVEILLFNEDYDDLRTDFFNFKY